KMQSKTYSTKDSRVVTHHSTYLAIGGLTMGERTGSRISIHLWPYVNAAAGEQQKNLNLPHKGQLSTSLSSYFPQLSSQFLYYSIRLWSELSFWS
ncbi:hypothetical protein BJ508DRAFT_203830, partial [Ascobolus immersus RN42]